jgi:SAM-dependent methyltransferase
MKVTRGNGALEGFLARQRMLLAERLIPERARSGRILDVGCGTSPLFLMTTRFREKCGLDKISGAAGIPGGGQNISLKNHNMEKEGRFPYGDGFFDVVTMLAVFEHIEPGKLSGTLKEVKRVLKPEGAFILTTPAAWTDRLLRILATIRMVSREEIDEHKDTYSHRKIVGLLKGAGFNEAKITCGYFEAYMNLWVKAVK